MFERIGARLGTLRSPRRETARGSREPELVELLLEHYYDPLYKHSEKGRGYAVSIDATDPVKAAAEVVGWIEQRLASEKP